MEKQIETNSISTGAIVTVCAALLAVVAIAWAYFRDSGPLNFF